jgi:intracellular septation protein A
LPPKAVASLSLLDGWVGFKTHGITPLLEIIFLYNEVATTSEPEDQKSGE